MNERLKVSFELSDKSILDIWDTPECIDARNTWILAILEDECRDDLDTSRFERLKEFWLIKT